MQKKIIALAIASALTAPAVAMADSVGNVSLYGQANMSIDIVNDGAASSASTNRLVNNNSRLGVKGSEDLGGGLTAVFQAEGSAVLGGGFSFDRNTFIGLSSADMGTALVGQHDTPYKISTRSLDVFADKVAADNRPLMGHDGLHDARLNNVIAYISPAMSGFTVAAASVFGAESAVSGDTKGGALSIAGMYSLDNLYATLAYQNIKIGTAGSGMLGAGFAGAAVNDEAKALKFGASYTMDAFKVNGVYEQVTFTENATGDEWKNPNFYLAGQYSLNATDAVKLAYTNRADDKMNGVKQADTNKRQVSVGYDHNMSKRTTVYALYTKLTDAGKTGTSVVVQNPDPSTISFGLTHAF